MFSRVSALPVLALALLAVATPYPIVERNNPPPTTTTAVVTKTITVTAPASTVTTVSQCNTGSIQCCDSVQWVGHIAVCLSKLTSTLTWRDLDVSHLINQI